MTQPVTIRPIATDDRPAWDGLFSAYAAFYSVPQTPHMRAVVWDWLMTQAALGFVAEIDKKLIGFAHIRPVTQTLTATTGGFLDDLFVAPDARGSGAARALIIACADYARAKGWSDLSWLTADNNYRARSLYDQLAQRAGWITYEMALQHDKNSLPRPC